MSSLSFTPEDIARAMHQGQSYGKGDLEVPYVAHVEAVVRQVVESFGCEPYLTDIAWLHDVIEDTVVTKDDLRAYKVPEVVIQSVSILTKKDGQTYSQYIALLKDNRNDGDGKAWKVKVADTLSNLAASVLSDEADRVKKYSNQLVKLYRS